MTQLAEHRAVFDSLGLLVPNLAVLLMLCAGILIMAGARSWGTRLLVLSIVIAAIGPAWRGLAEQTLLMAMQLPWWLQIFFGSLIVLGLLRIVLIPFLGRDAAAGAVGSLAAQVIYFIFRIAFLPLRFIQRWIHYK